MRMEQYLHCIDYTLWKIIENGNAPIVTKTVDGKETVIHPTSVEEKAQNLEAVKANLVNCKIRMVKYPSRKTSFRRRRDGFWSLDDIYMLDYGGQEDFLKNTEEKKLEHGQQRKNWV
ncbi:hypothetical protein Tco_1418282 [Tanacetum coccineum]